MKMKKVIAIDLGNSVAQPIKEYLVPFSLKYTAIVGSQLFEAANDARNYTPTLQIFEI